MGWCRVEPVYKNGFRDLLKEYDVRITRIFYANIPKYNLESPREI
jgi:hypothetical protein